MSFKRNPNRGRQKPSRRQSSKRRKSSARYQPLEPKQLLATIIWDNPNIATNGFTANFGTDAAVAKQIVDRAIDTWEGYISNFNYQNVGTPGNAPVANTYNLEISAANLGAIDPSYASTLGVTDSLQLDDDGKPFDSRIRFDDNAAGSDWYFDNYIVSDAEFNQIRTAFSADLLGANVTKYDFFTVALHEVGHSIGFLGHFSAPPDELMNASLTPGNRRLVSTNTLQALVNPSPNGFGHDYTLSSQTATDNMYVHQHSNTLIVNGRGANLVDSVIATKSSNGDMIMNINGYVERTPASDFDDVEIRLWSGDDRVTISNNVLQHDADFDVDLWTGNDTLNYLKPHNAINGTRISGDIIDTYYTLTGPISTHRVNFTNVEIAGLKGGAGNDHFTVRTNDANEVRVWGYGGDDFLFANTSNTRVNAWGGDGDDFLRGSRVNDTLRGEDGADKLYGYSGNDALYGHDGNDILSGGVGNDYLRAGAGDDYLYGASGNDRHYGDAGVDRFITYGTEGEDYLHAYAVGTDNVRTARRDGSFSGAILEYDTYYATETTDVLFFRGRDGDDHFKINSNVGDRIDGIVDGMDGIDDFVSLPSNWVAINM